MHRTSAAIIMPLAFAFVGLVHAQAQCDWEQTQWLRPDPPVRDHLGWSIAMEGDVAIAGAPWDSEQGDIAGAAYVYERAGGAWTQVAKLTADDASDKATFGSAVALSGATVVIGAPGDRTLGTRAGAAYVFERVGGAWTQVAALRASDGGEDESFGGSVAISGDVMMVGAFQADTVGTNAGAVYVFERSGGVWSEVDKLVASGLRFYDLFGSAVALDGDAAVIGAPTQNLAGAAYVFERVGGVWTQSLRITGDTSSSRLGASVALSGATALVGAPFEGAGAAYSIDRSGTGWARGGNLVGVGLEPGDRFGTRTALHSGLAVVSASRTDGAVTETGAAHVFRKDGGFWGQTAKIAALGGAEHSVFGMGLATDGEVILAGAPFFSGYGFPGNIYAFEPACGCEADCDGDGALALADFLCFQNAFGAGAGRADCDGDFTLTFFDFLCFQNAFAAGCP
ncbi:MAG: hypothetical protein ACF8R7_05790 [Phycisphaerales bacterium JB039]